MQQPPNEKQCEETKKKKNSANDSKNAFRCLPSNRYSYIRSGYETRGFSSAALPTHNYPKNVWLFRYIIRARTTSEHISRVLNIVLHLEVFNNTRTALLELLITLINWSHSRESSKAGNIHVSKRFLVANKPITFQYTSHSPFLFL